MSDPFDASTDVGVILAKALFKLSLVGGAGSVGITSLSMALGIAIAKQAMDGGAGADDPRVVETLEIAARSARDTARLILKHGPSRLVVGEG